MKSKNENMAIAGVGVAACAVCCAGPIVGFLAAIGIGTALGVKLFGAVALVVGGILAIMLVRRRNRRAATCAMPAGPVDLPMPASRAAR
jgi:Na+/proline symporter